MRDVSSVFAMADFDGIRFSKVLCLIATMGLFLAPVQKVIAESNVLIAQKDPGAPNFFTVNFPPELGGSQTEDISTIDFSIVVDPEAHTANVLSWHEDVDPLMLGGKSTGDITILLGSKSRGKYKQKRRDGFKQGTYNTEETYLVFFEADLSEFGFESPFEAPSTSIGSIQYDDESRGRIHMVWTGDGEIQNPNDPDNPFTFTYECNVNANFETATVTCDDINRFKTKCKNGKLKTIATLNDTSRDGELAIIDVNGQPFPVTVAGNKATKKLRRRTGEQAVRLLTGRDKCRKTKSTNCGE